MSAQFWKNGFQLNLVGLSLLHIERLVEVDRIKTGSMKTVLAVDY